MINLHSAQIDSLSVHQIGNKVRNESIFLSEKPLRINDEQSAILKEYFLKSFREKEENYYTFSHDEDIDLNEIYGIINNIMTGIKDAHKCSKEIAKLLFEKSTHAHIKSGEICVVGFSNLILDNEKVSGVGIFKSESKHDFLQFEKNGENLDIHIIQGINIAKLDKGCLIFNTMKESGYKLLSVDNNRYDTKYWLEQFLNIEPLHDDNFLTKNYLKFCQNFAKDVVLPFEDKQQEVFFMNRTINHFAKNDEFEESNFLNEVIENPDLIPDFKVYKEEKGPKYSIEDISSFPIQNAAVKDARKTIKNVISLDTNIQIKMDFINPESAEKFVEKGWDEERQMYYYLVYFNRENKS